MRPCEGFGSLGWWINNGHYAVPVSGALCFPPLTKSLSFGCIELSLNELQLEREWHISRQK